MKPGLRSGQVAEAAAVNQQTLRYYERRGLVAEPDRTLGGHRLYPPETATILRVIKTAQRLGNTWTRSPGGSACRSPFSWPLQRAGERGRWSSPRTRPR
ncbi:MerR family DNA-binding transcriptional regulator [Micromonospora sp. NPDC005206]|uniref:MerR family DNA-binding transcriptional regulator n=1 Tax=Micromonospora sp. NPDC005206 TaxID=3157022 RepID=UPI0033A083D9